MTPKTRIAVAVVLGVVLLGGLGYWALDYLSRTVWNVMNPPPPRFSASRASSTTAGLFENDFSPARQRAVLTRYAIDLTVGGVWTERDSNDPSKDAFAHFEVSGNTVGHAKSALEPTARLALYNTKYQEWNWADGRLGKLRTATMRVHIAVLASEVFNRDSAGVSDEHLWLARLPKPGASSAPSPTPWFVILEFVNR